jgi:hypothetical protein
MASPCRAFVHPGRGQGLDGIPGRRAAPALEAPPRKRGRGDAPESARTLLVNICFRGKAHLGPSRFHDEPSCRPAHPARQDAVPGPARTDLRPAPAPAGVPPPPSAAAGGVPFPVLDPHSSTLPARVTARRHRSASRSEAASLRGCRVSLPGANGNNGAFPHHGKGGAAEPPWMASPDMTVPDPCTPPVLLVTSLFRSYLRPTRAR